VFPRNSAKISGHSETIREIAKAPKSSLPVRSIPQSGRSRRKRGDFGCKVRNVGGEAGEFIVDERNRAVVLGGLFFKGGDSLAGVGISEAD
jgi:hypothetical protein